MPAATLLLVHEPEAACVKRLLGEGFDKARAAEISSYLAQSTDLAGEFGDIAKACDGQGLIFQPVELDEASVALAGHDQKRTLVWTLTDGIAYFRGGVAPALARLNGLRTCSARLACPCRRQGWPATASGWSNRRHPPVAGS